MEKWKLKKLFMFIIWKWILPQKMSTLTPFSMPWDQSTVDTLSPIKGMKKMEKWKLKKSFMFVIKK